MWRECMKRTCPKCLTPGSGEKPTCLICKPKDKPVAGCVQTVWNGICALMLREYYIGKQNVWERGKRKLLRWSWGTDGAVTFSQHGFARRPRSLTRSPSLCAPPCRWWPNSPIQTDRNPIPRRRRRCRRRKMRIQRRGPRLNGETLFFPWILHHLDPPGDLHAAAPLRTEAAQETWR